MQVDSRQSSPGMREQTFHASCGKFDTLNFEESCDFNYSTGRKYLMLGMQNSFFVLPYSWQH
jgi:hypothetical protein